ncbi:hypothetical protein [Hymenobacter sp. HDW8]|uniref:hypothetical protein n=1 Tax=Hymenobacter sp. HDW8 TaxID=2714932 RepID=UPI00140ADCCA|nr:hypothetical protein [Hymenobacter sp. HDW8]QIL74674.1 hypothetical protein G7064_01455 [Hymenobacter sp. HDW8]
MTKEDFAYHLELATKSALVFTRTVCWNRLADTVDFVIRPDTMTEDAYYLSPLELARFQKRKLEIGRRLSASEVVERLWVEQHVPVYIDLSVYLARARKTTLELCIDRRLRQRAGDIYHQQEGYPPFHVVVPVPPYVLGQGSFHSNWQRWPWRIKLFLWQRWWGMRYRWTGKLPTIK